MELSAIYHRPESEYAYLYTKDAMHIRIRTKKDDISCINLHYGDSVIFHEDSYEHQVSMTKVASDNLFDYWQAEAQVEFARIQYIFEIEALDHQKVLYGDRGVVEFTDENFNFFMNGFKLPYFHEVDRCKVPEWVASTVWYQIFPERFANGNPSLSPENSLPWDSKKSPQNGDFFGGDLQGVIDKLDYLEDLGITGLYFCPVFEAPSNHKYDTLDYFEIDKHFGDKEVFKKMVDEAHARGMKVMLDAVFNHIGYSSPQWQDVLQNDEKSAYKDWFHIQQFPVTKDNLGNNRQLTYHAFAFQGHMPKLNTANPEVKEYLLSIATYWIEHFDIDAWRLDVANEIDHQFWKDFHRAVTTQKSDLYILGEIWHSSQPWLNGDEFHAVMNYPLSESVKDYFLRKGLSTNRFVSDIQSQSMYYRRQVAEGMFNLLDSHDTERILTTAKGNINAVKSALAFLFLQLGTPCIYYGTEVGLTGEHDPDCRKVMPWEPADQNLELLNFMKELIALRKQHQNVIQFGEFTLSQGKDGLLRIHYSLGETQLTAFFNQTNKSLPISLKGKTLLSINTKKNTISSCTLHTDGAIILGCNL
ncbi:neopullulanase [Streptococcus varani]|uniref:Neopullulanase n=1 Tax=Streptococcus varani TaxID=1608583 RepID=A0A0E4CRU5_9STRE|nr:glycoside hydrolase family 13 protein [Streptococcus varani]CQR23889.1 neopullulanase [Streptococcus varani]